MSVTRATQTSPPHSWTHWGVRVYNWDGVDTDGDSTLESVTVFKQSNWNDPGQLDYAEDVDWRGLAFALTGRFPGMILGSWSNTTRASPRASMSASPT